MAITPNSFRRLQEMLRLGQVGIGIRIIDELIEILQCFPNAHLHAIQAEILLVFR